jgi:hypothetical protein
VGLSFSRNEQEETFVALSDGPRPFFEKFPLSSDCPSLSLRTGDNHKQAAWTGHMIARIQVVRMERLAEAQRIGGLAHRIIVNQHRGEAMHKVRTDNYWDAESGDELQRSAR